MTPPSSRITAPGAHHLPGVGRNLQDHVGVYLTYRVDQPTYNSEAGLFKSALHGLNWLLRGRGPGTAPGAQAMAFVRSDPSRPDPDLQLHFTPVGYKLTPKELIILKDPVVTAIPNVSRPESRGHLALRSGDFRDPPQDIQTSPGRGIRYSGAHRRLPREFARFSRHPHSLSM